jgi:NitT/TauT family transport system substrate-binding protein
MNENRNKWNILRLNITVNSLVFLSALTFSSFVHAAETKNVRIMMDWIIQGTHAPFFVANDKGYFKEAGLNVVIDSGKGATNTAVGVASGVYQFGYVDIPTLVRFNAQNPQTPLVTVYMSFDDTPSCIVTLKSKGIRTPADLDGKKIAGGPGTAVHDTISILLHGAGADNVRINWVSVSPQLFAPMLKNGEVDGIGAFTNSQIPALLEVGYKMDEIAVLKYSEFGANLYGLGLVTTEKFASENPEVVRAVVRALNSGTKDTIANPDKALEIMQARDPMMKLNIEKVRLMIALGLTDTKYVSEHGLSSVTPERLKQTIDATVSAYNLSRSPDPSTVYTDKFLPPVAERMVAVQK